MCTVGRELNQEIFEYIIRALNISTEFRKIKFSWNYKFLILYSLTALDPPLQPNTFN